MNRSFTALLAAGIGFVILCTLGIWQLERLDWKRRLIAEIDVRLAAEPVPLETLKLETAAEFTKISATGSYVQQNNRFLVATYAGGGGWQVITPLLITQNRVILVDRGVIPADRQKDFADETSPAEPRNLVGILRLRRDRPGMFTPDNNPAANAWYWWDVPAMLASLKLPAGALPEAAVLQLLPDPEPVPGQPEPQPPTANLVNNHLQYALTWFAFAAILAVITAVFIRQQMKEPGA